MNVNIRKFKKKEYISECMLKSQILPLMICMHELIERTARWTICFYKNILYLNFDQLTVNDFSLFIFAEFIK